MANRKENTLIVNGWHSLDEYHMTEESQSKLIIIKLSFNHKKDGNVIAKINQLIREGWELVYIEKLEEKIFHETIEFQLLRWIA